MTDIPNEVPPDARCEICGTRVLAYAVAVQEIADDDGNPVIDAPIKWFHKECLREGG